MPIIPQYESKANLTESSNLPSAVPTESGKGLQSLGQTLGNVGERIQKVDEANRIEREKVIQETFEKIRKINYANQKSDADVAKKSWEYEDTEKRAKLSWEEATKSLPDDVRKHTEEVAKTISDQEYRQEWLNKQRLEDESYIIGQRALAAKKVVSKRKVSVLRDIDLEISNGINATIEQDKADSAKRIEVLANDPVNADIYDAEDRKKLVDDATEKIDQGIKDQKEQKAKEAKEIKLARAYAKSQKEDDLIKKRVDEQLTPKEVRDAMEGDNPIDARVGMALINSMKSPKTVEAKTDFNVYDKIMTDIVNPKKKATDIKATITEAFTDGELSKEDYKSLLYTSKLSQTPVFYKAIEEQNKPTNPWVAIWDSIKNKFSNPKDRAEVMSRVTETFLAGGTPMTDVSRIIKDAIKTQVHNIHDWMLTIPKGGTKVIDQSGAIGHINEDGELEEEEGT